MSKTVKVDSKIQIETKETAAAVVVVPAATKDGVRDLTKAAAAIAKDSTKPVVANGGLSPKAKKAIAIILLVVSAALILTGIGAGVGVAFAMLTVGAKALLAVKLFAAVGLSVKLAAIAGGVSLVAGAVGVAVGVKLLKKPTQKAEFNKALEKALEDAYKAGFIAARTRDDRDDVRDLGVVAKVKNDIGSDISEALKNLASVRDRVKSRNTISNAADNLDNDGADLQTLFK